MMKGSAYGAERLAGSAPLGLGSAKYAEAGCCARLDNGSCRTPGFTWTTSKPQAIWPDNRGADEDKLAKRSLRAVWLHLEVRAAPVAPHLPMSIVTG